MLATGPKAASEIEYILGKRALDLCASAAGLLLLGPLMLVIATVTLVRSGRPVLIAQERVGGGGKRFRLIKFRSLPVASLASSDREWTPAHADSWGRFLRRTGLDELPQLVNVLKGEMSLVGPRPERPLFVEQFRRQLPLLLGPAPPEIRESRAGRRSTAGEATRQSGGGWNTTCTILRHWSLVSTPASCG